MTLDLARPEHREELAEACSMRLNNPTTADRMLAAARGIASTGATLLPAFAAHVALASTSDSAAIVRALLESHGLRVHVPKDCHDFPPDDANLTVTPFPRNMVSVFFLRPRMAPESTLRMSDIPALIIALLACTDAAGAIAALRGAS